jgi:hypothetical protein
VSHSFSGRLAGTLVGLTLLIPIAGCQDDAADAAPSPSAPAVAADENVPAAEQQTSMREALAYASGVAAAQAAQAAAGAEVQPEASTGSRAPSRSPSNSSSDETVEPAPEPEPELSEELYLSDKSCMWDGEFHLSFTAQHAGGELYGTYDDYRTRGTYVGELEGHPVVDGNFFNTGCPTGT